MKNALKLSILGCALIGIMVGWISCRGTGQPQSRTEGLSWSDAYRTNRAIILSSMNWMDTERAYSELRVRPDLDVSNWVSLQVEIVESLQERRGKNMVRISAMTQLSLYDADNPQRREWASKLLSDGKLVDQAARQMAERIVHGPGPSPRE